MRRAIFVATSAVASIFVQPLDAQRSVETSNGRRSAVRDEASPGGTGEFAGAELGGMAQAVVACGVSNPAARVVFAAPFHPPAGTTSVEVRVDEWTHRLDFVMSDNVMMLAGSSSSGLVDRIRSGSQLDMRLGSADADHITWSWSLARSQSAIGTACGNPARARPCCRVCRTGKACGDSCISRRYTCRRPPGCACNGQSQDQEPAPAPESWMAVQPRLSLPLLLCPFTAISRGSTAE